MNKIEQFTAGEVKTFLAGRTSVGEDFEQAWSDFMEPELLKIIKYHVEPEQDKIIVTAEDMHMKSEWDDLFVEKLVDRGFKVKRDTAGVDDAEGHSDVVDVYIISWKDEKKTKEPVVSYALDLDKENYNEVSRGYVGLEEAFILLNDEEGDSASLFSNYDKAFDKIWDYYPAVAKRLAEMPGFNSTVQMLFNARKAYLKKGESFHLSAFRMNTFTLLKIMGSTLKFQEAEDDARLDKEKGGN